MAKYRCYIENVGVGNNWCKGLPEEHMLRNAFGEPDPARLGLVLYKVDDVYIAQTPRGRHAGFYMITESGSVISDRSLKPLMKLAKNHRESSSRLLKVGKLWEKLKYPTSNSRDASAKLH